MPQPYHSGRRLSGVGWSSAGPSGRCGPSPGRGLPRRVLVVDHLCVPRSCVPRPVPTPRWAARGHALEVSDQAFPLVPLTWVLAAQYVLGGVLALLWTAAPAQEQGRGQAAVVGLAVLALLLGGFMALLAVARPRPAVLLALVHACILSAQCVVAAGHAATTTAFSPLLMFLLWTTPYVGVFSRRARWVHGLSTVLCLAVANAVGVVRGVDPRDAAVGMAVTVTTVLIVMLLVSRVTDALHRQVLTDPLTGLANRRAFHAHARAALVRGGVAVVVIDLDRFKNVNDTYGHQAGDALLVALAPRLLARSKPGEVVARLGGDEFAVLCPAPGPDAALAAAERLLGAFSEPVVLDHGVLHVAGSGGVAVAAPGAAPETLLRDADTAMYRAKALTPGGAQLFQPGMHSASARLLALESELRLALPTDQLSLSYQPVVALHDGRRGVVGVEALLRWTSPVLGVIDPGEFVPVAESTGLIGELGARVLRQALDDLLVWRRTGVVDDGFRVAVNVSAHQVVDGLPGLVAGLLDERQLPPGCLGIEVTESAVMRGEVAERVLAELSALGVTLLLDDFGTGQSSLAQLHRFPFDVVKVDRSFVARMTTEPADRAVVQAIVSLADALGLTVIAEGVETAEHERALVDLRCCAGQGWLYSRAVPAPDLPEVLARLAADEGGWLTAVPEQRDGGSPLPAPTGDCDRASSPRTG